MASVNPCGAGRYAAAACLSELVEPLGFEAAIQFPWHTTQFATCWMAMRFARAQAPSLPRQSAGTIPLEFSADPAGEVKAPATTSLPQPRTMRRATSSIRSGQQELDDQNLDSN